VLLFFAAMKCREFISGFLVLPFVRWFAARFKLLPPPTDIKPLWRTADELSPNPVESMRRMMSALPPERF